MGISHEQPCPAKQINGQVKQNNMVKCQCYTLLAPRYSHIYIYTYILSHAEICFMVNATVRMGAYACD